MCIRDSALAHAEIEAIAGACARLGGWRLSGCDLYVTLEPCPMCAGAIINARLSRVVQGTADPKAGSCGSVVDLFALPYNHRPVLVTGVLEEECAAELTGFFQRLRRARDGKKRPGPWLSLIHIYSTCTWGGASVSSSIPRLCMSSWAAL